MSLLSDCQLKLLPVFFRNKWRKKTDMDLANTDLAADWPFTLKPGTHYPYIQPVIAPYIWPVYTGTLFVPVYMGRIHGLYIRVVCIGHPYIRVVYMGAKSAKKVHPYIRVSFWTPVYTGRVYGLYLWPVYMGSVYWA